MWAFFPSHLTVPMLAILLSPICCYPFEIFPSSLLYETTPGRLPNTSSPRNSAHVSRTLIGHVYTKLIDRTVPQCRFLCFAKVPTKPYSVT